MIDDTAISAPQSVSQYRDRDLVPRVRSRLLALPWQVAVELGIVLAWTLYFGRSFLDLNANVWPNGNDFSLHLYLTDIWRLFRECGPCMLWNGAANGGHPALGDQYGSLLHPVLIIPSLFLHPVSASKMIVVASLALAGIGQWWLGWVMGLGALARVWGALIVVTGGHLVGRMYNGQMIMVLSLAAASLTIAPALDLARTGRRRTAIVLAICLTLAFFAGHGYYQLGIALGLVPALVVFLWDDRFRLRPVWRAFLLVGGLTVLLSGIYLLPLLHFWPSYDKISAPNFIGVQPLEYIPLNLVIRDGKYYFGEILGKTPAPENYINFIGWIPVLFALFTIKMAPRREWRTVAFFMIAIILLLLSAAGVTFRIIQVFYPGISTLRQPPVLAFMVVPFAVGLAAWGVDLILKMAWPYLSIMLKSGRVLWAVSLRLLVFAPLAWGSLLVYEANRSLLASTPLPSSYSTLALNFITDSTQWVETPRGDMKWMLLGRLYNFKVVVPSEARQWGWRGRQQPATFIKTSKENPQNASGPVTGPVEGWYIVQDPLSHYAYIEAGSSRIPCRAKARGGNIDVDCASETAGTLVVQENNFSGWGVSRDGVPVSLKASDWLSTEAPAGQHRYAFRYRPWDVAVGGILTLIGIIVAVVLWWRSPAWSRARQDIWDNEEVAR